MTRLGRLLSPAHVAIIGGGTWCANVIDEMRKIGFDGRISSVHPGRPEFGGLQTVPSVRNLPDVPDVAYVGVNRAATIDVVRQLSEMGAGGAICFASGFDEAAQELGDAPDMGAALIRAAGDMPILGPNCYGLVNYLDRVALWPDQHGGLPTDRGVALVTQSSNIAINLTMQARGLPVSHVVTMGNQAAVGLSEMGAALIADPRVTALGLHIEGIDDLAAFEGLAHAAKAAGKPIVALKIGESDAARAGAISHTASIAGSAAGATALFARLGIGQARSLEGFLEALKVLHCLGPLPSTRIATASCSGGEAGLISDRAERRGLTFPALSEAAESGLRAALGPRVALANPLDYHTYIWGDVPAMTATFAALAQADVALACVVLDVPRADRCDPAAWLPVIDAVAEARAQTGQPMAILASLPETMPEETALLIADRGIVPLCGLEAGLDGIAIAASCHPKDAAPLLQPGQTPHRTRVLNEAEAKARLARLGGACPPSAVAHSPAAAAEAATEIGFPVALKGQGIAHKTEAGAVVLGLGDADAVERAASTMAASGFLIERMVTDAVAEILIGVMRDPAHGYVLTLASGGRLAELLDDSAACLVPASEADLHAALRQLRIWPVLEGYRGQPGASIDAIVRAVMVVQQLVETDRPEEIEINPLICTQDSAWIADALIRTGDTT